MRRCFVNRRIAARINFAQYFLQSSGAVAQLGERLVRNEEATGSIPVSSTIFPITCRSFLKMLFTIQLLYWNSNGTLGTDRSTKARSCLTGCF